MPNLKAGIQIGFQYVGFPKRPLAPFSIPLAKWLPVKEEEPGRGIMQFIKNEPDIPELFLQAHEDERVVFFCGVGISYPAGPPGFALAKLTPDLSLLNAATTHEALINLSRTLKGQFRLITTNFDRLFIEAK